MPWEGRSVEDGAGDSQMLCLKQEKWGLVRKGREEHELPESWQYCQTTLAFCQNTSPGKLCALAQEHQMISVQWSCSRGVRGVFWALCSTEGDKGAGQWRSSCRSKDRERVSGFWVLCLLSHSSPSSELIRSAAWIWYISQISTFLVVTCAGLQKWAVNFWSFDYV